MACAATCILTACSDGKSNSGANSTEYEIKAAYAKKHNVPADTVYFTSYGEYNGAHAIMITAEGFTAGDAITYETVGGIILTYPTTHKMDVYYEGKFCSLPTAYETGLLTDSDLIEIAKKYGGRYLDEQKVAEIIAVYRAANEVGDGEEVVVSSVYGEVNGYYAVSVGVKGTAPYLDKVEEITVDGEDRHIVDRIVYEDNFGIDLYKDGWLYTLKYAAENKLISIDEYRSLCERNGFYFVD